MPDVIQLHWRNAAAKVVGEAHGATSADLQGVGPAVRSAHLRVTGQTHLGEFGYAALPANTEYPARVKALVERYRGNTSDTVVTGIGGRSRSSRARTGSTWFEPNRTCPVLESQKHANLSAGRLSSPKPEGQVAIHGLWR